MQSSIALALAFLVGSVSAFGGSFMGSRAALSSGRTLQKTTKSSLVMEDFGFLKGTGIGFDDLWAGNAVISEAVLEKELNKQGLRFKMNRTPEEAAKLVETGEGFSILGAPAVSSIWEGLGFTATSNNEARQKVKLEAAAKAAEDPSGARSKYLAKYGYPRLVGTKGIFYADQLSTDKQPMGGFGMGKSGVMWGVPAVVEEGTYGGVAGWGSKLKGKGKK